MTLSISQPASSCQSCEHRTLRLFCNLTPDALAAFSAIGVTASFPRGAVLFHEGDRADSVYVLCSGQAKLSCVSPAGKTMILKIAGPGDLLGLSATIAGLAHEVTAEAIEPVQIRAIPRAAFKAFLTQFGEASMHAAQSIQSDYRSAFINARLLSLSPTAAARLALVLLNWAGGASCGKHDLRFTMALTHEDLGSMANVSRETVTRLLTRFQKEKLLSVRGATMTILDPSRLRELTD